MNQRFANSKLDGLLHRYAPDRTGRDSAMPHWLCCPAIMFSLIGMLFSLNFGLSLIAVAFAILYYVRFGQRIAAQMAAVLLAMLAVWMLLMPAHHLVMASLSIFLLSIAGLAFGRSQATTARPMLSLIKDRVLDGPVYTLVLVKERLIKNPQLDRY